ncbi:hypothetical protein ACQUEF_10900 [Vagococcus fluvialis]|uniref:hypothetical protein n=1 Tax=Vagococcus fluvialis TaxID=2738 RepID=UPI003D133FD4
MTIDELVAQQAFQTTLDFLDTLKNNNITDINEYLLFNLNDRMKEELFTNIDFLADDTLWSKKELENFEVIAKTIDNDYLLSQGDTSLIIPSTLNKADSEIFDLPIWKLLIEFEEKTLPTNILALD